MFPIIKIRLTYVKRNLLKNIISLSYPIIIIYLFTIILDNLDKLDLSNDINDSLLKRNLKSFLEKQISNKKGKNESYEPKKHKSKKFELFDNEEIQPFTSGQIGLISENEDLLNKFNSFALLNFCFNTKELDQYDNMLDELFKSLNISEKDRKKMPHLSSFNCKTKKFQNKEEFNKYIYSLEYQNDTEFRVVFEIKKEKDIISFNIMSKDLNINSVDKSKNLLTLENPSENNNMLNVTLDPSKNDNAYKNYILIISNFLKLYSGGENININEKINIYYKPLNTPPIYNKLSNDFLITFIPMIISISFSSTLFSFVLWMVKEKSQNLHEYLFRYGITPNKYYK